MTPPKPPQYPAPPTTSAPISSPPQYQPLYQPPVPVVIPAPAPPSPKIPVVPIAIAVVLIVGVLIVVLSRSGGQKTSPTPVPAAAATAAATVAPVQRPAPSTPDELYHRLLEGWSDAVPAGFSFTAMSEHEKNIESAIGIAKAGFAGPDTSDVVFFDVFPDAAAARHQFENSGAPGNATRTGRFESGISDFPSLCDTWHTPAATASDVDSGSSYCDVLVGNVIVESFSTLRSDTQKGNNDSTIALAKAGVTHLLKVRGG